MLEHEENIAERRGGAGKHNETAKVRRFKAAYTGVY
jgi:hypothetical protein